MRPGTIIWILIAAAAVGGLILLGDRLPDSWGGRSDSPWLLYLLIIAVPALIGLVLRIRQQPLAELRNAAIWVAIVLVLLVGYSYRDELGSRVMGELLPGRAMVDGDGSAYVRRDRDGHFHVEALVNGTGLRFIVDTGASHVVLTPTDARRLGYDPDSLDYSQVTETAGGMGRGAPIRIQEVIVGSITLKNVSAMVIQVEMRESLLGMSFLSRLSGFEFSGDKMTLRR